MQSELLQYGKRQDATDRLSEERKKQHVKETWFRVRFVRQVNISAGNLVERVCVIFFQTAAVACFSLSF